MSGKAVAAGTFLQLTGGYYLSLIALPLTVSEQRRTQLRREDNRRTLDMTGGQPCKTK